MPNTAELQQLERLVRECKTMLRTLPADDPYRCQVGRTLREAKRRARVLQCKQETSEEEEAE